MNVMGDEEEKEGKEVREKVSLKDEWLRWKYSLSIRL